jgi:uncharacterized protein
VYRLAERIAQSEGADIDIVRAAALLHDVQSQTEQAGSHLRENHHHTSSDFARQILEAEGWPEERITAVEHCIRSHRFRDSSEPPQTLEARILFDADKLDAIGAIGVARAIAYAITHGQPAFAKPSEHFLRTGQTEPGESHSAYHEYLFKLRHLKNRLYTSTAHSIAAERHRLMVDFFSHLSAEQNSDL